MWRLKVCYKERSGLAAANERNNIVKQFYDKPAYSHAYEGDGKETENFFKTHSNFDDLINQMRRPEIEDFRDWTRRYFMDGQQWRGFDYMTSTEQAKTRTFDKFLDQSVLRSGVQLARLTTAEFLLGAGNKRVSSLAQLKALEGQRVFAKGSMSFGAAAEGLTIGSRKNVELKLSIPGGAKGAGMWIGDNRVNGWGSRQREFMTNRDTWYTIGKATYDKARDVYVVEIKYTGREKHDYGRRGK